MNGELKKIKKLYGEKFAHMCREFFPIILVQEGKLIEIITSLFVPTHDLFEDIRDCEKVEEFKALVYRKFEEGKEGYQDKYYDIAETPEELFAKAGYDLYRCENNDDIAKFKRYYASDEKLCTFSDYKRLDDYTIFWAVKKNVDKIKRSDFPNPRRQDEYGTSVISLQFSKTNAYLSIKNRYNHKVDNPDATFWNNLDSIYPGLTASFAKYYGLKYSNGSSKCELKGYARDTEGRQIKYNYELDGVYYCGDNYVLSQGELEQYDKSRYELIDYFLIDKVDKDITDLSDGAKSIEADSFIQQFTGMKNIYIVRREDGTRVFLITTANDQRFVVTVDKNNRIIGYENHNITNIPDGFLEENYWLERFSAHNVKTIGDRCCNANVFLEVFDCPNVESIGDGFLPYNRFLETLSAHKLKCVGDNFLRLSELKVLDTPELEVAGEKFLYNTPIESVSLLKLRQGGNGFMSQCDELVSFDAPMLEYLGDEALKECCCVTLKFPKLKSTGFGVLRLSETLEELEIPSAKITSLDGLLYSNENLKRLISHPISVEERGSVSSRFLACHPNRQAIIEAQVNPQSIADMDREVV